MSKNIKGNPFVKYSFLGIQMGVTIYLGSILGSYLKINQPQLGKDIDIYVTLVFVIISIYLAIKDFIKDDNTTSSKH